MASSSQTLPLAQERATLWLLAAVQFTHVLDFMIMMPLGSQLMRVFALSPSQFTHLVAAYGLAAAVSGLLCSSVLDRFDRRPALLWLYAGFGLATLACALAPTASALLWARVAAGGFGGVAASLVNAVVADVIPPERRGRGMSVVMTAFPLASVLGIPLSLYLTSLFNWHAPFLLLAGLSVPLLFVAWRVIPSLRTNHPPAHPFRQLATLVSHPIHQRALFMSSALVLAGNCIIPFFAPSLVANAGLAESQLSWVYLAGGVATLISTPWVGKLADRHDKLYLMAAISVGAAAVVLVVTRLAPGPLWVPLLVTAAFMVFMSGRFSPAMAMASNAIEPRYRAGFMSINSAVQQASGGAANLLAGALVTTDAAGHLVGLPNLGWVSVGFMALTLWLAARLRAAAPHAARTPTPSTA